MPHNAHASVCATDGRGESVGPDPINTWVCHNLRPGGYCTAITRRFPEGTGYCGRCPLEFCSSDGEVCLVVINAYVPGEEAADLRTIRRADGLGYRWDKDTA